MSGSTLSNRPRWVAMGSFRLVATTGTAAGNYSMGMGGAVALATSATGTFSDQFLRRDDYDIYERQQEYFLEVFMGSGDVAPVVNVYTTLFPVSAFTGLAAAAAQTLGTEVPGARSATVASPGANTMAAALIGPQTTIAADGLIVPVIHIDAAMAATSYLAGAWRIGVVAV